MHSVAWNCEGTKLASGSYDKSVTLWSLDADKLVRGLGKQLETAEITISMAFFMLRATRVITKYIQVVLINSAGILRSVMCLQVPLKIKL